MTTDGLFAVARRKRRAARSKNDVVGTNTFKFAWCEDK